MSAERLLNHPREEFRITYALAKQVPDIEAGAVFHTSYGILELNEYESKKVAELVRKLLRQKLAERLARMRKDQT